MWRNSTPCFIITHLWWVWFHYSLFFYAPKKFLCRWRTRISFSCKGKGCSGLFSSFTEYPSLLQNYIESFLQLFLLLVVERLNHWVPRFTFCWTILLEICFWALECLQEITRASNYQFMQCCWCGFSIFIWTCFLDISTSTFSIGHFTFQIGFSFTVSCAAFSHWICFFWTFSEIWMYIFTSIYFYKKKSFHMLVLDFLQGFENSKSQLTVRWWILTQILEKCKNLNADVERLRSSKACSVVTNAEHIQNLPFQTEKWIFFKQFYCCCQLFLNLEKSHTNPTSVNFSWLD